MRYHDGLVKLWKKQVQAITDGTKILTVGALDIPIVKIGVKILPAADQTKEERDKDFLARWLPCELPQDLANFDLAQYLGFKGAMKVVIAEGDAIEE